MQTPTGAIRPTVTAAAVGNGVGDVAEQTETSTAAATAEPTRTSTVTGTAAATAQGSQASPTATAATVPSFDHIYVIVFENKESTDVVGSDHAPYLNSLIQHYGLAINYTGVAHPSQPNYLAIWAGSTFGVADDRMHDLNGETLGDQLDAAGKSWGVYAENYPVGASNAEPSCFLGASSENGEGGQGSYSRKHNPAMSFVNFTTDAARCATHIFDLGQFDAAATDFSLIVPNSCHDMHDCPVTTGDSWFASWLPGHILDTQTWKTTNSALFITWDEGDSQTGGGGTVPMIVVSRQTPTGFTSATPHNHYSLLATVQAAWKLGCLRNACSASDLAEFFGGK